MSREDKVAFLLENVNRLSIKDLACMTDRELNIRYSIAKFKIGNTVEVIKNDKSFIIGKQFEVKNIFKFPWGVYLNDGENDINCENVKLINNG